MVLTIELWLRLEPFVPNHKPSILCLLLLSAIFPTHRRPRRIALLFWVKGQASASVIPESIEDRSSSQEGAFGLKVEDQTHLLLVGSNRRRALFLSCVSDVDGGDNAQRFTESSFPSKLQYLWLSSAQRFVLSVQRQHNHFRTQRHKLEDCHH